MKRFRTYFKGFLILLLLGSSFPILAQHQRKAEPYAVVFKLKSSAAAAFEKSASGTSLQKALKRFSTTPAVRKFPNASSSSGANRNQKKSAVDLSLIYEVHHSPTTTFEQVKKELLSTGQVAYVEPLYTYAPLYQPNDPAADSTAGAQRSYLKKIMAYAAWDITKGDSNVVIGILDTGVRLTHEDLQDKIKYNYADPIDGLDNDKDGYTDNFQGWDLADADNAPTADASGHGTSVAAIAAAHADNGKGMAGVGFKCKFLPVKIYASNSGSGSFKGYEGIVYAADHGCSVINLSWGGAGYPSAFEQDIINYAVLDKNVVIIAAAGNTNAELDFYPASYQNVVSVGGVGSDDIKTATHTYSYNIDISALSTRVYTAANENNSHYVNASGTSMSAPIVSGAAALVRSHYKDLTAQQIGELLRATADDIYAVPGNENYLEKLGKGRLNIKRALTETNAKSVRVIDWNLVDKTANKPGAVFEVKTTYQNFLSPLSDLRVSVTTSSPYIQVINGLQTVGSMATLGKANNEVAPFRFKIAENTPPNTEVALRVGFTDGSFTDYQYLKLVLHPDFVTTDVNHVVASVTSRGNLAYDGYDFKIGHGVSYKSSEPLLAEGGLLVGYSPTLVSDNVRNEKGTTDKDFYTVSVFNRIANSSNAPFEAFSLLEDSLTTGKPKSLQIRQNVYAWADEPNKDFILLEYVLTNRTTAPIAQAFAGIYADWDIIAAGSNLTEWDSPHKLGIIRHTTDKSIWAGIQVLGNKNAGFYAFENSTPAAGTINIADGFTTEEKYQAMSGGVQRENAGSESAGVDVSYIISSPIKPLAPDQKDTVAFALVLGNSKEDLLAHAQAAETKYRNLVSSRVITSVPQEMLSQEIFITPNPTNGTASVQLPERLRRSVISYHLVDATGKTVLLRERHISDNPKLELNNFPAGIYYLRLTTVDGVVTKKIMVRK